MCCMAQWSIWRSALITAVLLVVMTTIYTLSGDTFNVEEGIPSSIGVTGSRLPPCGEVCQYQDTKASQTGLYYPMLIKQFHCDNIIRRMAYKGHKIVYPPPKELPKDMYNEYTLYGQCPVIKYLYFVEYSLDGEVRNVTFTKSQMDNFVTRVKAGENIGSYEESMDVLTTIRKHKDKIAEKGGLVIGTQRPWVEAMLLSEGVQRVTTLEYGNIFFEHPKLQAYTPYTFADRYLNNDYEPFDFAVSLSSLEHSGLGRYGDPLNPFGDLEAMAQIWCLLKDGGLFILGIPGSLTDRCGIEWNANRVYGVQRLQHLTANWEVKDSLVTNKSHIVLILRKNDLILKVTAIELRGKSHTNSEC